MSDLLVIGIRGEYGWFDQSVMTLIFRSLSVMLVVSG